MTLVPLSRNIDVSLYYQTFINGQGFFLRSIKTTFKHLLQNRALMLSKNIFWGIFSLIRHSIIYGVNVLPNIK